MVGGDQDIGSCKVIKPSYNPLHRLIDYFDTPVTRTIRLFGFLFAQDFFRPQNHQHDAVNEDTENIG